MSETLGQFVRARLDEVEDTPARQATRRLIAEQELADAEAAYPDWMGGYSSGLDYALQLAATEWADHPDFSPDFTPESQWGQPTA